MTSTPDTRSPAQAAGGAVLRSVELTGPAGRLEALLNSGAPRARYAAVVCHPHPLGGGTLHNKVVYHAMKALNSPEVGFGWPVLRFNFRGTGLSEGAHHGTAESGDVLAALRWLENEFSLPLVVVGFSFGAAMALAACCTSPPMHEVRAMVALGLPTHAEGRDYTYPFLSHCSVPKLFLSGDQDQFASVAELQHVAATTAEPKKLVLLPGADHFFTGQLNTMQNAIVSWLQERLP